MSHLAGVFFAETRCILQVLGCHHKVELTAAPAVREIRMSPGKEELDLTTQWAKVMEAIKPRRGYLALTPSEMVGACWSYTLNLDNR